MLPMTAVAGGRNSPCRFVGRVLAATPRVVVAAAILVAASACNANHPDAAEQSPDTQGFSIYTLSRGKGVPQDARSVLAKAEGVLAGLRQRGADIILSKERIGLEGETRLCATFADRTTAQDALDRVRELISGVDLVSLSNEPCGEAAQR
jgi:hypothetical protein